MADNKQANTESRELILRDSHLWGGERYGPSVPGTDGTLQPVKVPPDFPETLKGLDAPDFAKSGRSSALDVNSGGPPQGRGSSDTEEDSRSIALGQRTTLDGEDVPEGLTGDNLNHATTGLHTVSHPEQPPAGVGFRSAGTSTVRAPAGAGLPDSNPGITNAAESIGQGGKAPAKGKGATGSTGLSSEALEEMTVDELKDLAAERGVDVKRGDGGDGAPLKSDYVKALARK